MKFGQSFFKYFDKIVCGLRALHNLNILHRDLKVSLIKSANVFLYKNFTAKLGDLNVSKITKKGWGTTQTGTPYYASPEVWNNTTYNKKSDIWSLGCVLYEMASLKPPFMAKEIETLYQKVLLGFIHLGAYKEIPNHYSKELSIILSKCFKFHTKHAQLVVTLIRTNAIKRFYSKKS